jgi:hypothetical protein
VFIKNSRILLCRAHSSAALPLSSPRWACRSASTPATCACSRCCALPRAATRCMSPLSPQACARGHSGAMASFKIELPFHATTPASFSFSILAAPLRRASPRHCRDHIIFSSVAGSEPTAGDIPESLLALTPSSLHHHVAHPHRPPPRRHHRGERLSCVVANSVVHAALVRPLFLSLSQRAPVRRPSPAMVFAKLQ